MERRKIDRYRGCFIRETQRKFKCEGITISPGLFKKIKDEQIKPLNLK